MYPTSNVMQQAREMNGHVAARTMLRIEQLKGWVSIDSGHYRHRKAFVLGAILALTADEALAQQTGGGAAGGADTDPFKSVSNGICKISQGLKGTIGLLLVILMIIIAGISLAVGGRNSVSTAIAALVGAAVIFGARTIVGFLGLGEAGACGA